MLNTTRTTAAYPRTSTGTRCHQLRHTALWVAAGSVRIRDSNVEAHRNDLLVIPAGVEHAVLSIEDSVIFPLFSKAEPAEPDLIRRSDFPRVHHLDDDWMTPILHSFLGWASPVRPVGHSGSDFFSSIDGLSARFPNPSLPSSLPGIDVCENIVNDPGSPLSIDDFAVRTGVSSRTLRRIFLHETGLTVSRWRLTYRMSLASRLLLEGYDTTYVADRCGYDTTDGFARAFTRIVGTPPVTWLAQHGGARQTTQQMSPPPVAPSFSAYRRNTTFSVLLWMHKGSATVTIDDRTFRLRRGEAVWIPDHTTSVIHADADSLPMPLTYWPEELNNAGGSGFPGVTSFRVPPSLEKPMMQHMISDYTALKPTVPEVAAHLRRELLKDLVKLTTRQRVLGIGESMVRPGSGTGTSTRTLHRVKEGLLMLGSGRPASSVARRLGYSSASQFSRDVRTYTGAPPSVFFPGRGFAGP